MKKLKQRGTFSLVINSDLEPVGFYVSSAQWRPSTTSLKQMSLSSMGSQAVLAWISLRIWPFGGSREAGGSILRCSSHGLLLLWVTSAQKILLAGG